MVIVKCGCVDEGQSINLRYIGFNKSDFRSLLLSLEIFSLNVKSMNRGENDDAYGLSCI